MKLLFFDQRININARKLLNLKRQPSQSHTSFFDMVEAVLLLRKELLK